MTARAEPVLARTIVASALERPIGAWMAAAAFALAGAYAIHAGAALNSEGLALDYASDSFRRAPLAIAFFLRLRPACAVFYAPFAAISREAFFAAHVLVAAVSLPALAAIARATGLRFANLPVILVATSLAFFYSANSGIPTSDGLAGVTLFAWLWLVRRNTLAAGLVLGVLPFARPELALLAFIVVAWTLFDDPRSRLLVGVVAFPLVYLTLGALYHRDAIWFVHYPPHPPHGAWGRGGIDWAQEHSQLSLTRVLAEIIACSPFFPLALIGAFRAPHGPLRALATFTVGLFVVLNVLPQIQLFTGSGGRYFVVVLPFAALFAASLVEDACSNLPRARILLAVAALVAAISATALRREIGPFAAITLALGLLTLALAAMFRTGAIPLALTIAIAASSPFALAPLDRASRERAQTWDIVRWLTARGLPSSEHVVYTNAQLLEPALELRLHRRVPEVRFFFQDDITLTVTALTNPNNGQRRAVLDALRSVNGTTLYAADLDVRHVPANSVFVLRNDRRLWATIPERQWRPTLQRVYAAGSMEVYTFTPPPESAGAWMQ